MSIDDSILGGSEMATCLKDQSSIFNQRQQHPDATTCHSQSPSLGHSHNILNEPVAAQDSQLQLQHRKSIHEYNSETLSTWKQVSGSEHSKLAAIGKNSAVTGLVSEAFRKRDKYTKDQMIKANPQLRAYSELTNT